jgi:hypothetical protein
VDLDFGIFVSWKAIMAGGVGLLVSDCNPGRAVLSVLQFHVIILVVGFV